MYRRQGGAQDGGMWNAAFVWTRWKILIWHQIGIIKLASVKKLEEKKKNQRNSQGNTGI